MALGHSIWIDLDNTPHVPFFHPIVDALTTEGCEVIVTARDAYNVENLLKLHQINCKIIGRHFGKNKAMKLIGLMIRTGQLIFEIAKHRPQLAVSHGSRAQILACKLLRIPSVVIADYEHVTHVARPDWLIIPELIPESAMRGLSVNVRKYPGIKEDVYASKLTPDSSILKTIGVSAAEILVVARPPASEAHYHCDRSDVAFYGAMSSVLNDEQSRVVLLPRNRQQEDEIRSRFASEIKSGKMIVPTEALNGLNLIWHSDLVISGGGTMNREACALGVPVYSTFCGPIGAVDRYLEAKGRLVLLHDTNDIANRLQIVKRARPATPVQAKRAALETVVSHLTRLLSQATMISKAPAQ